jgi:hypothetical protein
VSKADIGARQETWERLVSMRVRREQAARSELIRKRWCHECSRGEALMDKKFHIAGHWWLK